MYMYTKLRCAIFNGDVERIRSLRSGINERNEETGETVIFYGVCMQSPLMLTLLLELGADPHVLDNNGRTCLMNAVQYENIENTKTLLSVCKVDPNIQDKKGSHVLSGCILVGTNIELIKVLLDGGANPNLMDGCGETILSTLVTEDEVETIELFMRYGADPRTRDIHSGDTALSAAIGHRHLTLTMKFMPYFSISEVLETRTGRRSRWWTINSEYRKQYETKVRVFVDNEVLPRLILLLFVAVRSTSLVRLLPVDILRKLKTMICS